MTNSIGSTSSSNYMSSLRPHAVHMANRQRTDLRNASAATSTQVKSEIQGAGGTDAVAAAKRGDKINAANVANFAQQLDSQYSGMGPKGFSRDEVNSQLSSVNTVGSRSTVMSGVASYEVSQADKNGDGRIGSTEGEDYVANKTGLADDVKRVKAHAKAEKAGQTEQDNKVAKSGNADGTTQTGQTDKTRQEKKTESSYQAGDVSVARQMLMAQAYSAVYQGGRSGQLYVSA